MTGCLEGDEGYVAMMAALADAECAPEPSTSPAAAAEAGGEDADGKPKLSKRSAKKLAKFGTLEKGKVEKKEWGTGNKDKKKKKEIVSLEFQGVVDGSKKRLDDHDMPDAYHPKYVEAAWGEWWEKSGFYQADVNKAIASSPDNKFVMVIPPPNVTGYLHLGHGLTAAIEDTLTRWHRMCGHSTLYVPGIDHAGIATQTVVEKRLAKDEGLSRHDLGREKFVERVWEWKKEYGGRIQQQIRKMGSSVDWSREAFTMDDNLSAAVLEAFVRMHEAGIIYRDTRLVNWSCSLKSAISDIEVDYLELEGKTMLAVPGHTKRAKYEFGTLTHFAYKVDGRNEELVVATTRLETMLGDTAVAVHPEDPRYTHLHGCHLVHPFNGRKIPLILDAVLVDMAFGTGAVKITPAHDPNDYECGKRHNLPLITILNTDGTINEEGGPFTGMMRYDARFEMEKKLDELGLLRGKEDNAMRLGLCSRSKDIIEPYLAPQWYVSCKDMAKRAVEAVKSGDLNIVPSFHVGTWYRWLDDCRDWCVSRQLWWGHRIPAYFATKAGEGLDPNDAANNSRWVVARTETAARVQAAAMLGCSIEEVKLEQDPDVLDTWFSSGLFPFSVFGWPRETEDMKAFFPTTLLETGMDILFFWVARMVMMSLQLTDQLPFKTVYLHAMVRDKYGRKMSKSLGNVVDPLEVVYGCPLDALHAKLESGNLPPKEVEKAKKGQALDFPDGIPECGTDALRFGLLAYTIQGRDISLDISRVVSYRQFCNKLWNATRFALMNLVDFEASRSTIDEVLTPGSATAPRDVWILSRLNETALATKNQMENYEFGAVCQTLYSFWLNDLCDYYLELTKPTFYDTSKENEGARLMAQKVLFVCLDSGLRLLHPMMPFVTEDLWQRLPGRGRLGPSETTSIMLASYPVHVKGISSPETEANFENVKTIIRSTRALRQSYNIKPSDTVELYVKVNQDAATVYIEAQKDDICTLAKAQCTVMDNSGVPPQGCAVKVVDDNISIHLNLKGVVDFDAEIKKLRKQLDSNLLPQIERLEQKIASDGFSKVPDSVKEKTKQMLEEARGTAEVTQKAIADFEAMM